MSQRDLYFLANLMIFFSKKKSKYFLFRFIFHICAKFQTKEKKKLFMACVFECFQSHCHVLKEFLSMMDAI
jgi:hypothetical protein